MSELINPARRRFNKIVGATMIGAVIAFSGQPAIAAPDFDGKTITWIIPFKEGGGSDKWARFYAPLLSQALPGKPPVVVKNMPGAGSTKGANYFASRRVKPDGLTILGTSGSTQFPYLLGDRRVKFDYKDWNVVLASSTGGVAYLPADLGAKWKADPKSVLETQFIYGSQGATRLDLVALLAFEMLGLKVEPVFGIKGRGAGRLMFERGEVNIDYQTSSAFISKVTPLVKEGKAVPIMTWGALDNDGNIVRDPTFPDLPTFKEVYTQIKGQAPSGDSWEAWKAFFIAGFPAQKMVFLPKGSSEEIVAVYTKAFEAVIAAPDFTKISEKHLGVYPQVTGDAAKSFLERGTQVDPGAITWIKEWLKARYNVKI
ncbi:MAG: hypothetical protein ABW092_06170 [Candidatus Thiodiazotropha sp.]